ncbi:uridine kinase family protein [Streptacidiphilus sp. PAMC 29251]
MSDKTVCDLDELALRISRTAGALGRAVLVGIDGPGASGKSTLADLLAERLLDARVVHVDDFYRPSAERPLNSEAIAAAFDLDRLDAEVLKPAAVGDDVRYQRYDWDQDRLAEWTGIPAGTPLIVEGVHSLHSHLRSAYTFGIFCDAERGVRLSRGLARDGEESRGLWEDEWMPAEDCYLAAEQPQRHADLVLSGSGGHAAGAPAYTVLSRRPSA